MHALLILLLWILVLCNSSCGLVAPLQIYVKTRIMQMLYGFFECWFNKKRASASVATKGAWYHCRRIQKVNLKIKFNN